MSRHNVLLNAGSHRFETLFLQGSGEIYGLHFFHHFNQAALHYSSFEFQLLVKDLSFSFQVEEIIELAIGGTGTPIFWIVESKMILGRKTVFFIF
jgi:hypothetical protein